MKISIIFQNVKIRLFIKLNVRMFDNGIDNIKNTQMVVF